jgi:hypothetical protein
VFWKLIEFISRIVSARRIRHVEKVGEAAALAATDPDAAIKKLADMEERIHPAVRSMHSLTWGRILDGIGHIEEAEAKVILAAKQDPSNLHAHLELAKMSGRKFQFKNARERLVRLFEEPDTGIQEQAKMLLLRLDAIKSGKEAKRYTKEATIMARHPIGPNGEKPGLPAELSLVDEWIARSPAEAVTYLDRLALLFGESVVADKGGKWRISLSQRHSEVVLQNGETICPFDTITNRFNDEGFSLVKAFCSLSK